jgi:hypothetical protein
VPWATVAENSFLASDEETRRDLAAAGFEILAFHDTTQVNLSANAAMRRTVETEGQPQAGVHVLMGELYLQSRINVLRAEEEGRIRTWCLASVRNIPQRVTGEGVWRRPYRGMGAAHTEVQYAATRLIPNGGRTMRRQ